MVSSELRSYRRAQARIAAERDEGLCQVCLRKEEKITRADDIHHVFGRSRRIDWREHNSALVCVCRKHHPSPLYSRNWDSDHWIIELAREIRSEND